MNSIEMITFVVIGVLIAIAGLQFPLLPGPRKPWAQEHYKWLLHGMWIAAVAAYIALFHRHEAFWEFAMVLTEIWGVSLLAREVWFAQHMEMIRQRIEEKKLIIELYDPNQLTPFLAEAIPLTKRLTPDELKTTDRAELAERLLRDQQAALAQEEAAYRRISDLEYRRRWLRNGVALVVVSLLGHSLFSSRPAVPPEKMTLSVLSPKEPIHFGSSVFVLRSTAEGGKEAVPKQGDNPTNLTQAVCAARAELQSAGAQLAIVVGRHDWMPMKSRAKISNLELAQQRAESVAAALTEPAICRGAPIPHVITLAHSPGLPALVRDEDRNVSIIGIGENLGDSKEMTEKSH